MIQIHEKIGKLSTGLSSTDLEKIQVGTILMSDLNNPLDFKTVHSYPVLYACVKVEEDPYRNTYLHLQCLVPGHKFVSRSIEDFYIGCITTTGHDNLKLRILDDLGEEWVKRIKSNIKHVSQYYSVVQKQAVDEIYGKLREVVLKRGLFEEIRADRPKIKKEAFDIKGSPIKVGDRVVFSLSDDSKVFVGLVSKISNRGNLTILREDKRSIIKSCGSVYKVPRK